MATPTSLQRLAKRALLVRAKADAGLTALVPATSIAPDGAPSWPFILITSPRTLRLRASCVRGARVSFDVHAFAGPRKSGGAVCRIEFSDMQLLPDDEPDHWHWISQLNCRVLAE